MLIFEAVPPITTDLGSWAALVGVLLPALCALLQHNKFTSTTNAILFGVGCVAAAALYGWIRFGANFDWAHWEAALLAIITWGTATYHLYWKPSQIVNKLRAVPTVPGPKRKH